MILEDIRTKTAENHKLLEQASLLLPITERTITLENYIEILKKFYGFFHPLEKQIDNFSQIQSYLPDYSTRRKADLICQDLVNIAPQYASKPIALCKDLPAITNTSQAFGCLYVMEGSTLGGKMIAKIVKEVLQLDTINGASFFNGYGKETSSKWKLFQQALIKFSHDYSTNHEIIDAANETFFKFEQWIIKT